MFLMNVMKLSRTVVRRQLKMLIGGWIFFPFCKDVVVAVIHVDDTQKKIRKGKIQQQ
jgi:hypothetical protein